MDVVEALRSEFGKEISGFEAALAKATRDRKPVDLSSEVQVFGPSRPVIVRFAGLDDPDKAAARGRWASFFARLYALAGAGRATWGDLAIVQAEVGATSNVGGRVVKTPPSVRLDWGTFDAATGVERTDGPQGPTYRFDGTPVPALAALVPAITRARALHFVRVTDPAGTAAFLTAHDWPSLDALTWPEALPEALHAALLERAPQGFDVRVAPPVAPVVAPEALEAPAAPVTPAAPVPSAAGPAKIGGVPVDEMGEEVELKLNFHTLVGVANRLPAHVRRVRVRGSLHNDEDVVELIALARRLDQLDVSGNQLRVAQLRRLPAGTLVGVQGASEAYRARFQPGVGLTISDMGRQGPTWVQAIPAYVRRLQAKVADLCATVSPTALVAWPAPPPTDAWADVVAWVEAARAAAPAFGAIPPLQAALPGLGRARRGPSPNPGSALFQARDALVADIVDLLPFVVGAIALSTPGVLAWAADEQEAALCLSPTRIARG